MSITNLSAVGIFAPIAHNPSVPRLYKHAMAVNSYNIASTGALLADSGEKTGRSPKDKRIVKHAESEGDIWWGPVNIPISEEGFAENKAKAITFLDGCSLVYVIDAFAGWDPEYRVKVRVVTSRAYHALFMWNMLIRPTDEELENYGEPDYVIYNAGETGARVREPEVPTPTSVSLNFETKEFVILGSEYAGEMKKGIFTVFNYIMPKQGILSMHCSANEGNKGDVSLFFGLSGTGKTTLSADPQRNLIGDDEHCWTDTGVFNIEGGCYAKCIDLSAEKEPEIWEAIRFGTVLENVVFDRRTHTVDYTDNAKTENTRASYPIEFIDNAKIPCVGGHPDNIIFLTCDAFGVLPPVSKLTPEQAMYYFISGYTAKVAGTEMGVTEPQPSFSACFGAPFLVWHPAKYAELLAEKMKNHKADAWLVNTGWTGGAYGTGQRINLPYTRAIIDGIHSGELAKAATATDPVFGLEVPTTCSNVPDEILVPEKCWKDAAAYRETANTLAGKFVKNFEQYAEVADDAVKAAGPRVGL